MLGGTATSTRYGKLTPATGTLLLGDTLLYTATSRILSPGKPYGRATPLLDLANDSTATGSAACL
jgi:hypothetical protein